MHDLAGGMIVGAALVMLLSRATLAFLRQRAIDEARTQHFSAEALAARRARQNPLVGAWASVPPRLRIGLAMGAVGAITPFAARKLSGALLGSGDGDGGDGGAGGALSNALVIAGKWLVIGGVLTQVRKWGVGHMQQLRRRATTTE